MISPHTPPGTRIVCVDDVARAKYNTSGIIYGGGLDGLKSGETYTVHSVVEDPATTIGFNVVVAEISRKGRRKGFTLERFRYAELPKCLTELLNTTPVRDKELAR